MKQSIIAFLKKNDNYNDFDDKLIDELIYNFELMRLSKIEIAEYGVTIEVKGTIKKNPALDTYQLSMRNVKEITGALGITPKERVKLKIELTKALDEYESAFNG